MKCKFVHTCVQKLFTLQLVRLQLQGGMLGPIQIVLICSLFKLHLHFTVHTNKHQQNLFYLMIQLCIIKINSRPGI